MKIVQRSKHPIRFSTNLSLAKFTWLTYLFHRVAFLLRFAVRKHSWPECSIMIGQPDHSSGTVVLAMFTSCRVKLVKDVSRRDGLMLLVSNFVYDVRTMIEMNREILYRAVAAGINRASRRDGYPFVFRVYDAPASSEYIFFTDPFRIFT